ncbi:SidA/IucD/PvdA family monooxygenase [Leifsonia sp. McL0607]|uniref:SidA/IucD/PvdA family monooxygenase n=1 Tax=Leifsonia sp. McL0607 TaxID=3415672 RepID=UPI003CFBC25E
MQIMDVIGIGFGPSNIALAIALEESGAFKDWLFLESAKTPIWQGEMLFEISLDTYSNIQNIPYRDLVTPRNPRSRYTFLNYLVENDLLFPHLNMDMLMPLRPDYARYLQWVARQFDDRVRYGRQVYSLTYEETVAGGGAYHLVTTTGEEYYARHVVVGTGRLPNVPAQFASLQSDRVVHQTKYQSQVGPVASALPTGSRVAVVGSSQSAGEIILHLSKSYPTLKIHSIMRRYAFPLKDTSPFMSEAYFPEFTDLYYRSSPEVRERIDRDIVRTNYGSCDMDVLEELYRQMYYDKLHGKEQIRLHRLTDIVDATITDDGGVRLLLEDHATGTIDSDHFDLVVLATGFSNIGTGAGDLPTIPLLEGFSEWQDLSTGHLNIDRGYAVRFANAPENVSGVVVLNGLCERTHGIGDGGSLSLTAIRSAEIIARLQESDACLSELASAAPMGER